MTNLGALCAAAQRARQAARAALEDVLIDVFLARPGEAAGVVAAQHEERGRVSGRVAREDGGAALFRSGAARGRIQQREGSAVGARRHGQHEGRLALPIPGKKNYIKIKEHNSRFLSLVIHSKAT